MSETQGVPNPGHAGVTVIIATYNRAEVLRRTLSAMVQVDRRGIDVEFVLVDNNSTDCNGEVIASFGDRLPLRHLFEKRPGKNCALNKALDEVELREIVMFTDDDVLPGPDWLQKVVRACAYHKNYDVFGGKIDVAWPCSEIPDWATHPYIMSFGYTAHDLGESETLYGADECPFGPNFWVRRCVFADGRRYNERVGLMGSETTFLRRLADDGYAMMYIPSAIVKHCIQEGQVSEAVIRKRAYRLGRSRPHFGLCRAALLKRSPLMWRALRVAALVRYSVGYLLARCVPGSKRRLLASVNALRDIGYNVESLALARHETSEP